MRQIPFHIPYIGDEEIQEVISALKSGWITTGPRTKEFEKKIADYVGARFAVAVNSCTAGLHLALAANDIGPGDEVITTPYTFAATAEVILHAQAKPIFVDVEEGGYNIDPERIKEAISSRTKAIIPVHFAGEPCRMDEIMEIAKHYDLLVIEDAAHALGASFRNNRIGSIGTATAFSFYATKNLTTGEGGMVTTNDRNVADRMRMMSLHGLSRDAWKRYSREGSWYYEICELGYKYNMSDIQAAIGLRQLEKFDELQFKRKQLAEYYQQSLSDIEEIILRRNQYWSEHAWHLFVIRLEEDELDIDRNEFITMLGENGIGTSVHFIPLHLHPYYRMKYGYETGDFPNAEDAYETSISLPLYPKMTIENIDYIADIIRSIIVQARYKITSYVYEETW